jgi:Cft2 family RNA processing exonuclease
MQSGTSRELFELWAPDSRNGLIVTGYSVEGTLARVSHPSLWELLVAGEVFPLCIYTKQWMSFSYRV